MPKTNLMDKGPVLKNLDSGLLFAFIALCVIGLIMVTSATIPSSGIENDWRFFYKHSIALMIGTFIFVTVLYIPIHFVEKNRGYLFILSLITLALVLVIGQEINGAKRWIGFGGLNFQPSEFAKLVVVIFMAGYLNKHADAVSEDFTAIVRLALPFGLMAVLLILEPDFGSVAVITAIIAGLLIVTGAPFRYFIYIVGPLGLLLASLVLTSDYRMNRIEVFFDPWASPFGSGYQMVQALIASGSGGWTGLGLGNSVQKMLYLPDSHTDFIFSVYAEEFGFMGVVVLISLYLWLVTRIFAIGRFAMDKKMRFGAFVCYGIAIWIAIQMFINIGGNLGALPSKGLTLPFISYGGSSLMMYMMSMALVMRIYYEASMVDDSEPSEEVPFATDETQSESLTAKKTSRRRRSKVA